MVQSSLALACAILVLAMQTTPLKEIITIAPAPVGPYSGAVKAGGFIYVSAALAQDSAGNMVGTGDVAAQTRRVIERMREVLTASGSSLEQVVAVMVYLKSAADFAAMNETYKAYWPSNPPTRTTVVAEQVLPEALVEMSMIAVPVGAERTVIHPRDWIASPNPYSYAIKSGETLFLSGLVSRNGRDNTVVGGDIATQTRVVMDNAGELLKAAGMSYTNVVSSRVFLSDTSGFPRMNEVYRGYFREAPPARATVGTALASSQYLIEITMVASAAPREVIFDGRSTNPNISAAIRAGRQVYLSGVLGNTSETKNDVAAQTREALTRIARVLEAAGCTKDDVVDGIVYLTDVQNFGAMNQVYREFFQRNFPARATVRVGLVPSDGLVEIMMTAVKR